MKKLQLKAKIETINGKLVLIIPVETNQKKVSGESPAYDIAFRNVNFISRVS